MIKKVQTSIDLYILMSDFRLSRPIMVINTNFISITGECKVSKFLISKSAQ